MADQTPPKLNKRLLNAYGKQPRKAREGYRYFLYTGKNLLGFDIEEIISAHDEAQARDNLAKQFVKVATLKEIPFGEYQKRFDAKRKRLQDIGEQTAREKTSQLKQSLDDGTADPDEVVDDFVARFKQFIDKNKNETDNA